MIGFGVLYRVYCMSYHEWKGGEDGGDITHIISNLIS